MLVVDDKASDSDHGRQRRNNEDSLFSRAPLFAVADGMGGAQAGEIASGIAVSVFERGLPDGTLSAEERLADLVRDANEQIHELSVADAEHAGMGTTLTAAYVGEDEIAIAHVGDSRLYCLRDGALSRLTKDHSLVEELVEEGRLTPQEADEHPQRSIITRALGPEHDVRVDSMTWRGQDGDVYLICSDGLTSMISEAHVAEILNAPMSLRSAVRALIAAANDAGGRDNITVILFRIREVTVGAGGVTSPGIAHVAAPGAGEAEQPTIVGAPAVHATPALLPEPSALAPGAEVSRRLPRTPTGPQSAERERGPLRRAVLPAVFVSALLFALGFGGWIATQSVYFIGSDDDGFVVLYRGVPYELPLGFKLYTRNYVSGVAIDTLPARVRTTVTDHELRSRRDAADLVGQMELGTLEGQQ